MRTVRNGVETESACDCCGQAVFKGAGELQSEGKLVAEYRYRWPQGHKGLFSLAMHLFDESEVPIPGVIALRGWVEDGGMHLSVLRPEDSPWSDFGDAGPLQSREHALDENRREKLFAMATAIVKNDERLGDRVFAYVE